MSYKKNIIVILVLLFIVSGCSAERLYRQRRFVLGTIVEVISPYPEAVKIAFTEIERVENIFSPYKQKSAVRHLNDTGFLNTNYEVAYLIQKSKIFYQLSDGLFDITIAPVSEIWKKAFKEKKLPKKRTIKEKLRLVGFKAISVDKKHNNIKFKNVGMKVDLGGIVKGYAIDAAIRELKRNGIDSAIVNAGGDMYCLGSKFGRPWEIGLQHPRNKQKILQKLALKDLAVATSGDYEQFIKIKGKRYSHIINPQTGYPVENDLVSVTVVAKDALTADAVATCIFLLGEEKGRKIFTNFEGVKKIITIRKEDVSHN